MSSRRADWEHEVNPSTTTMASRSRATRPTTTLWSQPSGCPTRAHRALPEPLGASALSRSSPPGAVGKGVGWGSQGAVREPLEMVGPLMEEAE